MANPISEEERNRISSMIDDLISKAKEASKEYMKLDQDQIDNIVKQMSMAGLEHHMELAKKWQLKKQEEEFTKIK